MINGPGELLEKCFIVPIIRGLLNNDVSLVVGDFVDHEGWLVRSFIVDELLERGNTLIRDLDTIDL